MRFLRVLGYSVRDAYDELFLVMGLSVLWFLAQITVVAAAPATAALACIGYRLAREQRVSLDFAKEAFREHFWLSWRTGLAGLAVGAVIAGNIVFYARLESWLQGLVLFFLFLALAWISVWAYAFPLISAMKTPSGWGILRNAAILTFASPVFSLALAATLIALAVLSLILVLPLLVAPGLASIIGGRALVDRLDVMQSRHAS